jgi:hypothetical protein
MNKNPASSSNFPLPRPIPLTISSVAIPLADSSQWSVTTDARLFKTEENHVYDSKAVTEDEDIDIDRVG